MSRVSVIAGIVAAGLFASSSAGAAGSSYTIDITGYVPIACSVNASATTVTPGSMANLGTLAEFCNDPMGYQVWADYTPGDSSAAIAVDGTTIALSPAGSTMIDSSKTAAKQTHNLTLEDPNQQITTISMRIVPL